MQKRFLANGIVLTKEELDAIDAALAKLNLDDTSARRAW